MHVRDGIAPMEQVSASLKVLLPGTQTLKYGSMDRNMIAIMYRMSGVWQEAAMGRAGANAG